MYGRLCIERDRIQSGVRGRNRFCSYMVQLPKLLVQVLEILCQGKRSGSHMTRGCTAQTYTPAFSRMPSWYSPLRLFSSFIFEGIWSKVHLNSTKYTCSMQNNMQGIPGKGPGFLKKKDSSLQKCVKVQLQMKYMQ